jgi:RNA polymerase subunit RPABC4/transcription elongation factor Spt4
MTLTPRQANETCPNCGSSHVEVGRVVLACLDCDWTLAEGSCDTCGEPAVGSYSVFGHGGHFCEEHFPEQDTIFREIALTVRSVPPQRACEVTFGFLLR